MNVQVTRNNYADIDNKNIHLLLGVDIVSANARVYPIWRYALLTCVNIHMHVEQKE